MVQLPEMHWLLENYRWLFDGVAGAAIIAVIGFLVHRFLGPNDQQQAATLAAQGAKVTNSPVASGYGISQVVNSPTVNVSLPSPATPMAGPDLSLEWKHAKNSGDFICLRNIGNASAFNIGLEFSWEELFFDPPFDKNVLHPNQEITEHARFCERTGPRSVNLGWMDEILRIAYLNGRKPPLEVTLSFSDGQVRFEKPFTFELGPGGTNAERIRITPGVRRRIQAAS